MILPIATGEQYVPRAATVAYGAAVAVGVAGDGGAAGHVHGEAERRALLERSDEGEELGRRAGLPPAAAAVGGADRVVDDGLAALRAVGPVLGDGHDLAGAGLDHGLGVGVVTRVPEVAVGG